MFNFFAQNDTLDILISAVFKNFVTLVTSLKKFAKYRTGKKNPKI